MGKNKILFYMRIFYFERGSHTVIVRQTKQNAATLGKSLVSVGAPMAVGVRYALPRLRRSGAIGATMAVGVQYAFLD